MKVLNLFLPISLLTAFILNGTIKESAANLVKTGISSGIFTQDMDLAEGTYYIKSREVNSTKYLDVSWSCKDEKTCKVQLWTLGNSTLNNKWVVKNAGLPLIGGYTLTSKVNNNVLSALGEDNGDPVYVEKRVGLLGSHFRTVQEWKIKKIYVLAGGQAVYKIYNVAHGKYIDAVNSCIHTNGCKIQVWSGKNEEVSQEWLFIKTT